jgi:hypothetical protein
MEEYTVCFTRNERSGLARCKTSIWGLRGTRKESEKRRCREKEDAIYGPIVLRCSGTRMWIEEFLKMAVLLDVAP